MVKRIVAITLIVLLLLSVGIIFVRADDKTAEVYVTIADKQGKLALAAEKVTVTDIDGDNALTINDALYAAHEQFYDGGAAAGYNTEMTKYGLSLTKLWGVEDGYNYGYYVNNVSAWSMTDPVKADDHVAAHCFTDSVNLPDKYAYFENVFEEPETEQVTLTLTKLDYDAEYNPVTLAVEGAELSIDGEPTGVVTDKDGKATLSFEKNGKYLVSAKAATGQVIVPPVCIVTISCFDEATPDEAPTIAPTEAVETEAPDEPVITTGTDDPATEDSATPDDATKDTATKDSSSGSPQTNDVTKLWLWILIAAICLAGIVGAGVFYKKHYGKK